MLCVFENRKMKGKIAFCDNLHEERELQKDRTLYKFLRVLEGEIGLEIDDQEVILHTGEIVTLTHLHHLRFLSVGGSYEALLFNSNFYCIHGNDHEVSCNGLLFHGSSQVVKFIPTEEGKERLNLLSRILQDEFAASDRLQEEMLRILLKRYIILCTRIVRDQSGVVSGNDLQIEIIRKFYVLVDMYFREKKQVQEYAELLNKSPKTLTNILSAHHLPSAIRIIHERIEAEAKRLLLYTSKSPKEIAWQLGFEEQATFARFFKNATGQSCSKFRLSHAEK